MKGQIIKPSVLAVRLIANINQDLYRRLNLKGSARSIGIITADSDDVLYTALDEATKDAQVEVVYAKSMYAGTANASTKYAGEVIGIISGQTPDEVKSGIQSVKNFFEPASVLKVPMRRIRLSIMPIQFQGQGRIFRVWQALERASR